MLHPNNMINIKGQKWSVWTVGVTVHSLVLPIQSFLSCNIKPLLLKLMWGLKWLTCSIPFAFLVDVWLCSFKQCSDCVVLKIEIEQNLRPWDCIHKHSFSGQHIPYSTISHRSVTFLQENANFLCDNVLCVP